MNRTILTALVLAALACEQVPDVDTDSNSEAGTSTDTEGDTDTGTDSSSESGTDTGDTSTDSGTDTGASVDMWLVVDSADVIVGELATPDASEWTNHVDMFGPELPGVAYVTRSDDDGAVWGFNFNGWEGGLIIPNDVRFSGPDCTGVASTRFVTVKATGNSPAELDCNMEAIEAMGDEAILHFGMPDVFAAWVAWRWPGADGVVGRLTPTSPWYGIPVAQQWPAWQFTQSRRLGDGTCENTGSSGCSIELVDLGWDSMTDYADPIRLVHAIDG